MSLGYSREGDVVTLRMSVEDWELVLYALGTATGRAEAKGTPGLPYLLRRMTNRINAGRPTTDWQPIPEGEPES